MQSIVDWFPSKSRWIFLRKKIRWLLWRRSRPWLNFRCAQLCIPTSWCLVGERFHESMKHNPPPLQHHRHWRSFVPIQECVWRSLGSTWRNSSSHIRRNRSNRRKQLERSPLRRPFQPNRRNAWQFDSMQKRFVAEERDEEIEQERCLMTNFQLGIRIEDQLGQMSNGSGIDDRLCQFGRMFGNVRQSRSRDTFQSDFRFLQTEN